MNRLSLFSANENDILIVGVVSVNVVIDDDGVITYS